MSENEMPINLTDESIDEVGTADDSVMNEDGIPEGLLHGGDHREDVVESDLEAFGRSTKKRKELRRIVYRSGMTRPSPNFRTA